MKRSHHSDLLKLKYKIMKKKATSKTKLPKEVIDSIPEIIKVGDKFALAPQKSTTKLISYSIKAVIPTGPYANIQPEIVISANSIEDASAFVLPHLDELFEKYLNISERPKPKVTVKEVLAPVVNPVVTALNPVKKVVVETFTKPLDIEELKKVNVTPVEVTPAPTYPDPSSPMGKAKSAVESCKSLEALDLIAARIQESVKLDAIDKTDLDVIVKAKRVELSK